MSYQDAQYRDGSTMGLPAYTNIQGLGSIIQSSKQSPAQLSGAQLTNPETPVQANNVQSQHLPKLGQMNYHPSQKQA